ncbi:MAG: N-ethylmaleimide reductase [Legionellaceae bacterium]
MSSNILEKLPHGSLEFKNRVFMAPMTRSRAPAQIPTELMKEYYSQRSSAGLIFSEGTQISPEGIGYIATPGIYTEEQINGWKKITQAVHDKNGLIFCQLWHVGRVSHPDFHNGKLPVAPSDISFTGQAFTMEGPKDVVKPRALTFEEIKNTIADFKKAAQSAKLAGFDGVEIHAANGYLPAQFLEDGSNQRTDIYGGSLENRTRFILEVTDAAISIWGADRVSVRLSPRNPYNGMSDTNPEETYLYLIKKLEERNLGILHFMEPVQLPEGVKPLAPKVRKIFSGILVLNMGYDKETAEEAISKEAADAVSFASLFISNPDLPEKFAKDATLVAPDKATFYGGGAKGYTDYSFL